MMSVRKNAEGGFTLAELLIVVAIIAVLVAIAIPVFADQLEKSREATDAANIRSAYADLLSEVSFDPYLKTLDHGSSWLPFRTVSLTQKKDGWQHEGIKEGLIELFKDDPYNHYYIEDGKAGTSFEMRWVEDPENSLYKELGHGFCAISGCGILNIVVEDDGI